MIRCRLIAKGRVQGVNYRYFVCQQAASVNATGYVRNMPDGTVEIIAELADKTALERFKELVSRKMRTFVGPQVVDLIVEKEEEISKPAYSSFEIAY